MDTQKLHDLIDKVIGKEGPLRVSAWWMRKVFNELIKYIDTTIDTAIDSAKQYTDTAATEINSSIIENEEVIATALNDLNNRIKALEDK